MAQKQFKLTQTPVHLGLGAIASVEPAFTGDMAWYEDYVARHETDGVEGRLVSMYSFDAPWDVWEMHPKGHELVVCVTGRMTIIQEIDGEQTRADLEAGDAIINPPGAWHTADVGDEPATALFVTAGLGTQHRPRD